MGYLANNLQVGHRVALVDTPEANLVPDRVDATKDHTNHQKGTLGSLRVQLETSNLDIRAHIHNRVEVSEEG